MRAVLASAVLCCCVAGCFRDATPTAGTELGAAAPIAHRDSLHGYKTIFAFDGADGSLPNSPLTVLKGEFYGTTVFGGDWTTAGGTVFLLSTSGKEKVLHSFGRGADGQQPVSNLTLLNGTLYGVTAYGGKYGGGTVFNVTPSGSERVLHSFGRGKDGKLPAAALTALDGVLYGTTAQGGKHSSGVLYSITTAGQESVLYDFPRGFGDLGQPTGAITPFKGAFYGTSFEGGCGQGIAFSATAAGKVHDIYTFGCSVYGDASGPDAAMVAINNTFYGTTYDGGGSHFGGTVYSLTPNGEERVLHSFGNKGDGSYPRSVLIPIKGALYGVTSTGGANNLGTVFSLTTSGKEDVLYSFRQEPDGSSPEGGLVNLHGVLYGTTDSGGGKPYGGGTVFSISP